MIKPISLRRGAATARVLLELRERGGTMHIDDIKRLIAPMKKTKCAIRETLVDLQRRGLIKTRIVSITELGAASLLKMEKEVVL